MPELSSRGPNIRAHSVRDELGGLVSDGRGEQRLYRRTDAIHDRPQARRLVRRRTPQLFHGGKNRPAFRMPKDHHQSRAKTRCSEFHATDLRRRYDVARDSDDEQITESLPEYELGGDPCVGTPENDGKRLLDLRERCSMRSSSARDRIRWRLDKATVALA